MTPFRPRVAAAAVTTVAVLVALLAAPGAAVPIASNPGSEDVVGFLGSPREARPIPHAHFAPRHPHMAANGRSNIHDDAYQSDAGPTPGPLGYSPEVVSTLFTQECASVTFDQQGRLLTVCVGVESVDLRMLDPQTLDVLAEFPLPPRQPSATPFTSFGGGGYFYLDHRDRVVVPTSDGQIYVVAETGTADTPALTLVRQYDVSTQVGDSVILSALPDWDGRIWFVTGAGVVGTIARKSGAVHAKDLGEPIGNSVAVDETGGVYAVSDEALYRFDAGHRGRPLVTWRKEYDGGTRQKPGQTQHGSGTTPTIIKRNHRRFVAITDNADPRMHVVVYRAGRAGPGARPVCRVPVFRKRRGSTDNSLIAFGRSIVVENNYGYTGPSESPPDSPNRVSPTTEPGVTRIVVDYRHGTCRKAWTNHEIRVPSSVSKGSTATGLVYVYEHPAADEIQYTSGEEPVTGPQDPWYLTALDARTGERVWSTLTGTGLGYNNNYAPITLGPDGTAYVGVLGGLVAVRDAAPPSSPAH